jgi:hypothetical protein
MNKRLPYLPLLFLPMLVPLRASPPGQGANKLPPDQVEKVHSRLSHHGGYVGEIPDRLSKTTGDVHVRCVLGVSQKIAVVPPHLRWMSWACLQRTAI